jgi:hypothetical protein
MRALLLLALLVPLAGCDSSGTSAIEDQLSVLIPAVNAVAATLAALREYLLTMPPAEPQVPQAVDETRPTRKFRFTPKEEEEKTL